MMADYGMILMLIVLCIFFSCISIAEQHPAGAEAGEKLAERIIETEGSDVAVIIAVSGKEGKHAEMADALDRTLRDRGATVLAVVRGAPPLAGKAIREARAKGQGVDVIAADKVAGDWMVFDGIAKRLPGAVKMIPESYFWPTFLTAGNLVKVTDQIVIIAILAIGMTAVIITGGIDLSVGSLIALSAVITAMMIRDFAGGLDAGGGAMVLCCLAGIIACALVGLFAGTMVTVFDIPSFIATLAMMLVARGVAMYMTGGQSITHELPDSFTWLGRGSMVSVFSGAWEFNIPNSVLLAILLYVVAHVFMTRTKWGRYVYAVGGNAEAARLSGVPVRRVRLSVYTVCGALAGLGGVVAASKLRSGVPIIGKEDELFTIAAVVVGGASLAGGEGKIFGTLIGALIIAVIRNGMNLVNLHEQEQKIILGFLILAAVLLDTMKRKGWTKKGWSAMLGAFRRSSRSSD